MSAFMLGTSAVLAVYRGAQRVWEWTGAALFPRFWSGPLDPTGLRLFQDASGATQATAAGQPIGKLVRADGSIDATQATALSRPTLARWPKGGRRNLIASSERFIAPWAGQGGTTLSGDVVSFPGGANTLTDTTGRLIQTVTVGARLNKPFTMSVWLPPAASWSDPMAKIIFGSNAGGNQAKEVGSSPYGRWESFTIVPTTENADITPAMKALTPLTITGLKVQLEAGASATPYQKMVSANDISEDAATDVWHLYNDGGDSLLAPLPTGAHGVATVTPMGKVDYATVTGDGTGKNILFGERVADIFTRAGTLSDAERLRLEEFWQQRYGAGYLIAPGMVPGTRRMAQGVGGVPLVTAVGNPVGLMVDPDATTGPELVTNGDFASGSSGWSAATGVTVETGKATFVDVAAGTGLSGNISGPFAVGDYFELSLTLTSYTSGNPRVMIGSAGNFYTVGAQAVGTFSIMVPAGGAAATIRVLEGSGGGSYVISKVSVKAVSGYKARQDTALSRPTLARWPKGGRSNFFSGTESPATPYWGLLRTTLTPTTRGSALIETTEGSIHHMSQSVSAIKDNLPVSFSFKAKAAGRANGRILFFDADVNASYAHFTFDLTAGTVTAGSGGAGSNAVLIGSPSIGSPDADGFRMIQGKFIANALGAGGGISTQLRLLDNAGNQEYTGDGVSGMHVTQFSVNQGETLAPYQSVVSLLDITEAGVPDIWHLYNDGGDSLPAVLPAGAWEIAWVNHLGAISFASVTSDGITGIDLLRAERMADVALKRGRFTSYEKAQLETQWGKYKP